MKYCPQCNQTLPVENFGKNKSRKDGLQGWCNTCRNSKHATHYSKCSKLKERTKQNTKDWRDSNRQKFNDNARRYRAKVKSQNNEKLQSHRKFRHAVETGTITPPDYCSINNKNCSGRVEGHHSDYSKPYDVTWLCTNHHVAWHRVFIAEGQ